MSWRRERRPAPEASWRCARTLTGEHPTCHSDGGPCGHPNLMSQSTPSMMYFLFLKGAREWIKIHSYFNERVSLSCTHFSIIVIVKTVFPTKKHIGKCPSWKWNDGYWWCVCKDKPLPGEARRRSHRLPASQRGILLHPGELFVLPLWVPQPEPTSPRPELWTFLGLYDDLFYFVSFGAKL